MLWWNLVYRAIFFLTDSERFLLCLLPSIILYLTFLVLGEFEVFTTLAFSIFWHILLLILVLEFDLTESALFTRERTLKLGWELLCKLEPVSKIFFCLNSRLIILLTFSFKFALYFSDFEDEFKVILLSMVSKLSVLFLTGLVTLLGNFESCGVIFWLKILERGLKSQLNFEEL